MLEADVEVDRRDFTVRAALRVAAGERLALFGPSGAGKTTVLEAIAGLVRTSRGQIMLTGRLLTSTGRPEVAVPPWQRRVGLLRQDPALFPHLSVGQNLRYAPSASGDPEELAALTKVLGIDGLLEAMPAALSGGQAHRVALGRLLLSQCDALLLDEPYTGLDLGLRRTLTDLVGSLVTERGVPSVLVAHELAEAQAFADRLVIIDRGSVLQVGAPDEVVRRPASRRVAELVGYTAFVPVPGPPGLASPPGPPVPTGLPSGDSRGHFVAGVHPDRIVAGDNHGDGVAVAGPVTACRPAGALWEISVRTGEVLVTGRLPERAQIGASLAVTLTSPPVFGPDGALADQQMTPR